MHDPSAGLTAQVNALLELFPEVKASWWSDSMEGGFEKTVEYERVVTQSISLVRHIYGVGHPHTQRVLHFVNEDSLHSLMQIEGLLLGAKDDIANGLIRDLASRIVLDIKAEFLETASAMADEGHKDPAAVLACIVLEDSLKKLAAKHSIANAADKEMSVVTSMLLNAKVIEKSTSQAIRSFLSLRNAAFHAQWYEVSTESVKLLLAFLPSFVEKHGI